MKKYLRIILSMLLVFAMALTIVACKPTTTPDGGETPGAGETPDTPDTPDQPDAPKEPEIVLEALNIDNGQHIAALDAVYNSGVDLINRAVAVYDICLEMEGVKVQPDGKITVSVPVLIAEISEYDVYHILSDGSVESIVSTVVDGMITFETESFSDFVFVSDEKYNIGDYNIASTSTVQVFQTMTIEKYELFIGFNGIDSVDDVAVYINGEEFTDFVTEENSFYIFANQFYNGERITISVVPNNGYEFGSYALYTYNSETHAMEFEYYSESEISVTLNDKWAGIIGCELFAPDVDRHERYFDITGYSEFVSLENLTFTINGVVVEGENYVREDGGCSFHINYVIKDGDVITISANLPAKCRFDSFILRKSDGVIIEETFTNSITFKVEPDTGSLDLRIEELDYLGMQVDGRHLGWTDIRGNMHTGIYRTTVMVGSKDTSPADFDVWVYTDYQEYLLTEDQYTIDMGGFDINTPGIYQLKFTLVEDPEMFLLFNVTVLDYVNTECDFSTINECEQYADDRANFGDVTVSTHNGGCWLTTQLRLYHSDLYDGYAVVNAPVAIHSITLNAGHKNSGLVIYGSTDGEDWTPITTISVVADYADYTVEIDPALGYTYLKLDSNKEQIRIQKLTVTYADPKPPFVVTVYAETDVDFSVMGDVSVSYQGGEFTDYSPYHEIFVHEDQPTVTIRQQAREGYVFLGWYLYSYGPDGKLNSYFLGTENQYSLNVGREIWYEARYEPIG